jgi:hypothetical protein
VFVFAGIMIGVWVFCICVKAAEGIALAVISGFGAD